MFRVLFEGLLVKQRHFIACSTSCSRHIASYSSQNQHSFTVNYLITTCGLSPESALFASKRVKLKNSKNADSVLAIFKNFGFSKPQISKLVEKMPPLLACYPEKTISPKLEFLSSKGFSSRDIVKIVTAVPKYFHTSLKNHIVPAFGLLRNLLKSDEKTALTIKRHPYLLNKNVKAVLSQRIEILHANEVCESNIIRLMYFWPGLFFNTKLLNFKTYLEEVRRIGFNPSKFLFVYAIGAIKSRNTPTWERKISLYKRWGLSEDEILSEFRKNPVIMTLSEERIMKSMDLFVNKLGWDGSFLPKLLHVIVYSFEKRLVPRTIVLQFLVSKGLVNTDLQSCSYFRCSEKEFLDRFVNRYAEAPEILKIYGKKPGFHDSKDVGTCKSQFKSRK